MADEKPKKVKVTLKVPMSEADLGAPAAKAGDEVEVDAEVAERWVAAGIAEGPAGAPAETSADPPAEKPSGGGVPRRGSS